MMLELFPVIMWAIAGILTLSIKEVPKLSYAMCWAVLMMYLIADLVGVIA